MKTTFRLYCGTVGDLQTLLIAESEYGIQESILISRGGCFQYWKMQNAKRKLLRRLEVKTGKKHYE